MKKQPSLPQLIKTVFEPESYVVESEHINTKTRGVQHSVAEFIAESRLIMGVSHITIRF